MISAMGSTANVEVGQWYVVALGIIVEFAFTISQATDALVGAHPDVIFSVYGNGPDVDVVQSALPTESGHIVLLVEFYQSFCRRYPDVIVTVTHDVVDGIGWQSVSVVDCLDLLHLG